MERMIAILLLLSLLLPHPHHEDFIILDDPQYFIFDEEYEEP